MMNKMLVQVSFIISSPVDIEDYGSSDLIKTIIENGSEDCGLIAKNIDIIDIIPFQED